MVKESLVILLLSTRHFVQCKFYVKLLNILARKWVLFNSMSVVSELDWSCNVLTS